MQWPLEKQDIQHYFPTVTEYLDWSREKLTSAGIPASQPRQPRQGECPGSYECMTWPNQLNSSALSAERWNLTRISKLWPICQCTAWHQTAPFHFTLCDFLSDTSQSWVKQDRQTLRNHFHLPKHQGGPSWNSYWLLSHGFHPNPPKILFHPRIPCNDSKRQWNTAGRCGNGGS